MPGAVSVPPSQLWHGNDGNWSTFALRIGEPDRVVNLLPATIATGFWPVHIQGCYFPATGIDSDPEECPQLRGGLFDPTASTSLQRVPCEPGPFCKVPYNSAEEQAGYAGGAAIGLDKVVLGTGAGSTEVEQQVVGAFANDYYQPFLGSFGLSAYPIYPNGSASTDMRLSMLQTLRQEDVIGSQYFAYTAGAFHRGEPSQYGSLTLGGYDALRGNDPNDPNRLVVPLSGDSESDLIVSVRNIEVGTGSTADVQLSAQINSRIPEIWLPEAVCSVFETAFGLEWNSTVNYYLVSEEQHERMLQFNRSVKFTLAANDTSSAAVPIELPYAAFDMELKWPLANITETRTRLRYFPLRRAPDDGRSSVLGRVFLQEAYLAVDYDKREFYLSQARFPDSPSSTELVCVGDCAGGGGISVGAIVGIAVGAAAVVIILLAVAFWFWRRRRRAQKEERELQYAASGVFSRNSIAGTTINDTPNNMEFYKADPQPGMAEHKPELDATGTARGTNAYHRHELSAGSVRRTSQQTGVSRSAISPVSNRHTRSMSYGSSLSQPSPSVEQSPSPGHASPASNHASNAWFGASGPFFELHSNELAIQGQQGDSERPVSGDLVGAAPAREASPVPAPLVPATANLSAPHRAPAEVRSPGSPEERRVID
ncbi:hypothetical protein CKM354_000447000 [Cercospora kikuchii]|uniref:Peptidase A1 domain-containing protein n=1 Tax=Cercospora kikuchii TaxID=84275 RepID=A0A9P3CJY5_9PEZI|nr:uncharacterized protein CKM354_000447000 [Cercospora kikuchii]GIZ41155.1 hypothetical protein CKM354_000447000 [Cercospora kikuchii]